MDFFRTSLPDHIPTKFTAVKCCSSCASLMTAGCNIDLDQARVTENGCELCALLLRQAETYCEDGQKNIHIIRDGSWLKQGLKGQRILRLYSDSECSEDTDQDLPISFPILPAHDSPVRFALLRAWLDWCDKSHSCNRREAESKATLPTRLLDIGDPNPEVLRLHCPSKNDDVKYVALSHRWGEHPPSKEDPQFCTTDANIETRRDQFSFSELPKTFQDAIHVTRNLGISYVWIDSLCIIQWNDEDWKHEAKRMEEVFASAYCTIAATSAADSKAGFLKRNVQSEVIYAQDPQGRRFYVCADRDDSSGYVDIDDFDAHVEKSQLNARAWVMQERVLSRRTIHFTDKQMFWECGEGVYCETLTKLESSFRKKFFMLDPNFPHRLLHSGHYRTIEFIHFLFEEYSKRGLTIDTDRRVAISGLEARIAKTRGCQSRYGVLERYLHRNLLWLPFEKRLKQIAYERQYVPSWSWMAYSGAIQFMEIRFGTVDWIKTLAFDGKRDAALITDVAGFRGGCVKEKDGDRYAVLDSDGESRGWIQYDVEDDEDGECLWEEQCVVAGRVSERYRDGSDGEYYVLVVRPITTDDEYKRVGVGVVQRDYVVRLRRNVRLV